MSAMSASAEQDMSSACTVDLRVADCIEFLRSLPPDSLDCIATDPAYAGMNQHMQFGHGRIVGRYQNKGEQDAKWFAEFHDDPDSYREFLRECYRVLRPDRHIYIMFDSFSLISLAHVVREVFDVKNLVVWDKVNIGMGHYFRRQHETVLFASKGKRKLSRRDLPDVWRIKRLYRTQYPTQKPVALFSRMLEGSVVPGMTVCDPFVGTGSAAIAALQAGCHFIGADCSERAIDLARHRCEVYRSTMKDPLES